MRDAGPARRPIDRSSEGEGAPRGLYHVVTLGCKLNRFDSSRVEGILRAAGYRATADVRRADVIVLNTCTVTGRADAEGRKLARRLRRANPRARLIATGCYAERDPEALRRLGVLDEVVGLAERDRLPEALFGEEACVTASIDLFFADRARAFLRIQEGCDLRCSYCVIPSVRGPSRSVPLQQVVDGVRRLADAGVKEVGLTGINTGAWGRDLTPRRRLAELLETLVNLDAGVRYRLNSLEPRCVAPEILDLMAARPDVLVPHLQVPLQSGSDRILALMSRNYRSADYRRVVESVAERVPDVCIGADVITGFPGETEEDFRRTLRLVESLPLAYLHVFSYSPRPGTRAASLPGQVDPARRRARTARLRQAGTELARAFRSRMLGRTFEALALEAVADDGARRALTGNYIEVRVPGLPPGELVPVRLTSLDPTSLEVRGERVAA
ncbi:MAG: MiaB/RimO family radical SAM methylthiotransferase [Acidobacteria bacterium]|nr:MAG: MiaB/RimO family radical SAM methylthiotransferase [Acidobacteriota bacterium]